MRYPSALPAVALAVGIAFGIFFPTSSFLTTVLLTVAWTAAFIAFRLRRDRAFVLVIFIGFALAGELLGARANADALHTPLGALFDASVRPNEYEVFATIEGTLRADA